MGLVDELARLEALRESGSLTLDEFTAAKQALIAEHTRPKPAPVVNHYHTDSSAGEAISNYVRFKVISAVVSVVLFLIVICVAGTNHETHYNSPCPQTLTANC
jgi:hypothetical protein